MKREDVWRDMRSVVQHEDALINTRLGWTLTFTGFLFAAFGLTMGAQAGLLGNACATDETCAVSEDVASALQVVQQVRMVAACAGIGSALAALVGALAGFSSIRNVVAQYQKHEFEGAGSAAPVYQTTIGEENSNWGGLSVLAVPCLLCAIWVLLLLLELEIPAQTAAVISLGSLTLLLILSHLGSRNPGHRRDRHVQ